MAIGGWQTNFQTFKEKLGKYFPEAFAFEVTEQDGGLNSLLVEFPSGRILFTNLDTGLLFTSRHGIASL